MRKRFLETSRRGMPTNIRAGVKPADILDMFDGNDIEVHFKENKKRNTLVLEFIEGNHGIKDGDVTRLIIMRDTENDGGYECYVSWYEEFWASYGIDEAHGELIRETAKVVCKIDLELLQTDADYCYAVMHELCDKERIYDCLEKGVKNVGTVEKVEEDYRVVAIDRDAKIDITNVQFHDGNMKRLQSQMITGLTHDVQGSIALSGMNATTDIGTCRTNQEDAVLLATHPEIPEFKILLVSDGVGGVDKGEVASHYIVEKMSEWFGNVGTQYYWSIGELEEAFKSEIERISTEMYREYQGEALATIVCAIVGKNETLIANVGDSRAYGVKDGKLKQFSKDDSVVQQLYDKREISEKDDMRFHYLASKITKSVGCKGTDTPNIIRVKNTDYQTLLLFSDGVTDCLSDSQILTITRRTPKEKLSATIVREALKSKSCVREELKDNWDFFEELNGGADNTTAAVYDNTIADVDER